MDAIEIKNRFESYASAHARLMETLEPVPHFVLSPLIST
jgi:hypothetical protein